jgi:hypothetical protein
MFRKINGKLLKKQRGTRSLQEIADLSDGQFTKAALAFWERGIYKPNEDNTKALLRILGCSYEDISEPVEVATV